MQFHVPQFIEKEAQIVGTLTIKQSLIFGAGLGLAVFAYFNMKTWAFLIVGTFSVAISIFLAFYNIKGSSAGSFMNYFSEYIVSPKLYLWKKEDDIVLTKNKSNYRLRSHKNNSRP